jgi:hypothetical protein
MNVRSSPVPRMLAGGAIAVANLLGSSRNHTDRIATANLASRLSMA